MDEGLGELMSNPEALEQLVASLPGVDPNSQIIRDAIDEQVYGWETLLN